MARTVTDEPVASSPTDRFVTIVGRISTAMALVAGVILVVMAIHVTLDVAARTFTRTPIPGTIEFISYWWMPSLVFLGIGEVERRREQISVTLVTDVLREPWRARAFRIARVLGGIALAFVVYFAFIAFASSFALDQTATGLVPLPIWLAKGVATLGLAQFLLQIVANALEGTPAHATEGTDIEEPA